MIEAIKARSAAATPELWEAAGTEVIRLTGEHWLEFNKRAYRADGKIANTVGYVRNETDAIFIAHARQDISYLLGEVERLQAANESLRKRLEGVNAQ